jgi:hypothetical protein
MSNEHKPVRARLPEPSVYSAQPTEQNEAEEVTTNADGTGDALAAEALFRLSSSPAVGAPLSTQGPSMKQILTSTGQRNSPLGEIFSRNGTMTPMFTGILGGNLSGMNWTPQALNDQSAPGFEALAGASPRWQTYTGLFQQQCFSGNFRELDTRRSSGAPTSGSLQGFPLNRSSALSPLIRDLNDVNSFSGNMNYGSESSPMGGARYAQSATAAILDALVGESAITPTRAEGDLNNRFRVYPGEHHAVVITEDNKSMVREKTQNGLRGPQGVEGSESMATDHRVRKDENRTNNIQRLSATERKRKRFHNAKYNGIENMSKCGENDKPQNEYSISFEGFIRSVRGIQNYEPEALQRLFAELCERYRTQNVLWPSPWDQIHPIVEERYEPDGRITKLTYIPILVPFDQNLYKWDGELVSNTADLDTTQSAARDSNLSGSISLAQGLSSRAGASRGSWHSESALAMDSSDKASEEEEVAYIPSPTVHAHCRIPEVTPDMAAATRKEIERMHVEREFKQMTRQAAIVRYRQKKKERRYRKIVRYSCRKVLADKRPRIRGRFVKQDPIAPG